MSSNSISTKETSKLAVMLVAGVSCLGYLGYQLAYLFFAGYVNQRVLPTAYRYTDNLTGLSNTTMDTTSEVSAVIFTKIGKIDEQLCKREVLSDLQIEALTSQLDSFLDLAEVVRPVALRGQVNKSIEDRRELLLRYNGIIKALNSLGQAAYAAECSGVSIEFKSKITTLDKDIIKIPIDKLRKSLFESLRNHEVRLNI